MSQSFAALWYHVVFATKDRQPWLVNCGTTMHDYLGGIIREIGGLSRMIGGYHDHVHLLASFRQDMSVAEAVRLLKTNSSKWWREREARFSWQNGYAAFSVSVSQLERVESYIARQAEHHRQQSFHEELVEFLDRHGVIYKPEFLS